MVLSGGGNISNRSASMLFEKWLGVGSWVIKRYVVAQKCVAAS
jgi:hypothetical protein